MARGTPGSPRGRRRLPHPGLEEEGFNRLLQLLAPDPEAAGRRYREVHFKLVRFFSGRRCAFPEDLADETLDRVARRLAAGVQVYSEPSFYVTGVAYRVYWEVASAAPATRSLRGEIASPPAPARDELQEERERQLDLLQQCLQALPEEQRRLLYAYYGGEDRITDRKRLCAEFGLSPNALRLQVHRASRRVRDLMGRYPRVTPPSRRAPRWAR